MTDNYTYTYHKVIGDQIQVFYGTINEILANDKNQTKKKSTKQSQIGRKKSTRMNNNKSRNSNLNASRIQYHDMPTMPTKMPPMYYL